MTTSIAQRINAAQLSTADKRELLAVFSSIQADLQAMATQFNQLRTDYNAALPKYNR